MCAQALLDDYIFHTFRTGPGSGATEAETVATDKQI